MKKEENKEKRTTSYVYPAKRLLLHEPQRERTPEDRRGRDKGVTQRRIVGISQRRGDALSFRLQKGYTNPIGTGRKG